VIDTDADPTWVTYPIPANDDRFVSTLPPLLTREILDFELMHSSLRCVQVIAGVLGRAGESGQAKRLEAAKTGEITWLPPPGLGKPYDEEAKRKEAEEAAARKEAKAKAKAAEFYQGGGVTVEYWTKEELFEELHRKFPEVPYMQAEKLLASICLEKGVDIEHGIGDGELSAHDKEIMDKLEQLRKREGRVKNDTLSKGDWELIASMDRVKGKGAHFVPEAVYEKFGFYVTRIHQGFYEEMQDLFSEFRERLELQKKKKKNV
jgi:hypothetical protein